MSDQLLLLAGVLLLYVPGALLLLVCRIRSPRVLVGLAPAVSVGVLQLSAVLGGVTTIDLVPAAVTVVGVLALAVLVLELRARRDAASVAAVGSVLRAARRAPAQTGIGAVLVAGAAWLGTTSWLRGYHGLATPPQEHDTVLHTLITAWIARTGHAAPWQVMPTDLATGGTVSFYPSGVHTVAGLLAGLVDDPVRGLNATTALVIGLVAPVTLFAAAAGFEPVRTRPAFAALAALLSVTLYRPSFQLAHDAGILAFGMGLALVPAVAVGLRGLGRRDWGTAVGLAVAALGLFTIHPSVAVIAIGVLVIGWGTALLSSSDVRTWTRDRLLPVGVTAVVAAVVAAPWVLAGLSVAGSVASYPEAPPVSPLGDVLHATVLFRYGGFIETGQALYQTGFAVLFWLGMLGCLTSRRLWPLAAAWLVWAAAAVLFATGHAGLPGLAQLGSIFFNSYVRILAVSWLLAPAVAALGTGALVGRVAGLVSGRAGERRLRWQPVLAAVAAAVLAVGYLAGSGLDYWHTDARAVAERWGAPSFYRVSPPEREAFDYLAAHRSEVGRVLNNGNDGSTYLYVWTGIPVVNTYPLGLPQAEYGIYLMEHFNQIGTDPVVRCLVQRYDITHVIVSLTSPPIGAFAAPGHWVDTPLFSYAPGLLDLVDVSQVHVVFANSDTAVFQVDPAVLAGDDRTACTADPTRPTVGAAGAVD